MPAPLSLKARAIAWLAQREQSEVELRRKLMVQALRSAKLAAQASAPRTEVVVSSAPRGEVDVASAEGGLVDEDSARVDAGARVDEVIAWLIANDYLSERRFVESRIHARASRFGNQRIRHELSQHGVALPADEAAALKASELARAQEVWQRRFGTSAVDESGGVDAAARARQARFLTGRGFSSETVRRVVLAQKASTKRLKSSGD